MIFFLVKSPTADVTWHKGAKRQMANLDRFLDELQTFDEHEITENTIKLLGDLENKINAGEATQSPTADITSSESGALPDLYKPALDTLHQWTKGMRFFMLNPSYYCGNSQLYNLDRSRTFLNDHER